MNKFNNERNNEIIISGDRKYVLIKNVHDEDSLYAYFYGDEVNECIYMCVLNPEMQERIFEIHNQEFNALFDDEGALMKFDEYLHWLDNVKFMKKCREISQSLIGFRPCELTQNMKGYYHDN